MPSGVKQRFLFAERMAFVKQASLDLGRGWGGGGLSGPREGEINLSDLCQASDR